MSDLYDRINAKLDRLIEDVADIRDQVRKLPTTTDVALIMAGTVTVCCFILLWVAS